MKKHLDGTPYALDPPRDVDGFLVRDCLRSGLCCKTATCEIGVFHGQPTKGCGFLRGGEPGKYRCGVVEDQLAHAEHIGVGWGCCMPMFNRERQRLVVERARDRLEARVPDLEPPPGPGDDLE